MTKFIRVTTQSGEVIINVTGITAISPSAGDKSKISVNGNLEVYVDMRFEKMVELLEFATEAPTVTEASMNEWKASHRPRY